MHRLLAIPLLLCFGCVPEKDEIQTSPVPVLTIEDAGQALLEILQDEKHLQFPGGDVARPGLIDLREGRIVARQEKQDWITGRTWTVDLKERKFKYLCEYGWGLVTCEGEFTGESGRWLAQRTGVSYGCKR